MATLEIMEQGLAHILGDSWWPLAGDQLFVDLDLSEENLPPRTRLRVGGALLEVSAKPHRGCPKFLARFGPRALAFVNTEEGRAARLRGLNARVVEGWAVRVADRVVKLGPDEGAS